MKNRILFLSNAYPDFDSSYRGTFVRKMATLLQTEGYQISVVTPKIYKRSHYFEDHDGIKVHRFPFLSGNKLLIEYRKIPYFRMVLYYISGFLFTICVLLRNKCDLIHAHWAIPTGLIGVLAGGLLRKTLVVTIHGSDFRMAMDGPSILKRLFLLVCRKAQHITCVSEVIRKEIEQLGIQKDKILTSPMGIDDVFLEARKDRKRIPNGRPLTVLSNRNLLPIYNLSLLIRAIPFVLKEEPDVRFLIAGDGVERKNLEEEAKSLNIDSSVQFFGHVPHEKMADFLTKADIYVSTSLHDGASVSLLEAMAAGAFPIVTDIPANKEWITDGENGFLIPTDGETFLARRILDAIRNKPLLKKIQRKNRLVVEEKALWPKNIKGIQEIYSEVLIL